MLLTDEKKAKCFNELLCELRDVFEKELNFIKEHNSEGDFVEMTLTQLDEIETPEIIKQLFSFVASRYFDYVVFEKENIFKEIENGQ